MYDIGAFLQEGNNMTHLSGSVVKETVMNCSLVTSIINVIISHITLAKVESMALREVRFNFLGMLKVHYVSLEN